MRTIRFYSPIYKMIDAVFAYLRVVHNQTWSIRCAGLGVKLVLYKSIPYQVVSESRTEHAVWPSPRLRRSRG